MGPLKGPVKNSPVVALVDDCPIYDLAPEKPAAPLYPAPARTLEATSPREILLELLRSPNIASRRPQPRRTAPAGA